jgi:hypothetical protein
VGISTKCRGGPVSAQVDAGPFPLVPGMSGGTREYRGPPELYLCSIIDSSVRTKSTLAPGLSLGASFCLGPIWPQVTPRGLQGQGLFTKAAKGLVVGVRPGAAVSDPGDFLGLLDLQAFLRRPHPSIQNQEYVFVEERCRSPGRWGLCPR